MKSLLFIFSIFFSISINAQTIDEIINNYFENTGGKENWENIEGLYTKGKMKMQGMEIPFESYQFKNGKSAQIATFQGKKMTFLAFDGETAWGTNFMNMKAEKKNEDVVKNLKDAGKEFPSAFLDAKNKGFEVSLEGEEDVDGTPTYKVKLVKDSLHVNGQIFPNVEYIYFDKENFVPILKETAINVGPMAGQHAKTFIGNYQEVNGLYFPFEMTSKINGQVVQSMVFENYEINPKADNDIFKYPEPVEDIGKTMNSTPADSTKTILDKK